MFEDILDVVLDSGKSLSKPQKRNKLTKAMERIEDAYCEDNFLSEDPIAINYNKANFRLGYLYKYELLHIQFTSYFLKGIEGNIENLLDNRNKFRICSLGGGPGTDIFGVLKFVQSTDWWDDREITGTIMDFYPRWEDTFKLLKENLDDEEYLVNIKYQQFDFFEDCCNEELQEVHNSDLVTMIKFISALNPLIYECQENLRQIFQRMKPGSILLYIDNACQDIFDIVEVAAEQENLYPILMAETKQFTLYDTHIGKYKSYFNGIVPIRSTLVTVAAWQKTFF